jgi:hypothetical protein
MLREIGGQTFLSVTALSLRRGGKDRINATDRNACPPGAELINYVNFEILL